MCVAIFLLFTSNNTFANSDMYKQQMKYYNNIKTCTKGTFSLGETSLNIGSKTFDVGMVCYIYGIQNNKCHIREHFGNSDLHCYLPINIAKKYAEERINTFNASMKNGAAYSQYINQIINDENYCKSNY